MYGKKALTALIGLVMTFGLACGNDEIVPGEGSLNVTVAQALTEGDLEADIVRVEVTITEVSGEMGAVTPRTWELPYNGKTWTSTLGGIKSGDYEVYAEAYLRGDRNNEPTFRVAAPLAVTIPTGGTPSVRLILNQVVSHGEGGHAPVITAITTSATALRPGEIAEINISYTDPDGDPVWVYGLPGGNEHGRFVDEHGNPNEVRPEVGGPPTGTGTVYWKAPNTQQDSEPIVIKVDDGKFYLDVLLHFFVIWKENSLTAEFAVNLAPVVTSAKVHYVNPDVNDPDYEPTKHYSNIEVEIYDSDSTLVHFEWSGLEACSEFLAHRRGAHSGNKTDFTSAIEYDLIWIGGENNLGVAQHCELTLTLTDAEGASTQAVITLIPYDTADYTPSIEIFFEGSRSIGEFDVKLEVISFHRLFDDIYGPPKFFWQVGENAPWQRVVPERRVPEEDSEDLVAYASERLILGARNLPVTDLYQCIANSTGPATLPVTAKACHRSVTESTAGNADALCSEVRFDLEVLGDPEADVCVNTPDAV